MSNVLSNMFHQLGDVCACGVTKSELDRILEETISSHQDVESMRQDLRNMKELIGYLGMRLDNMTDDNSSSADIININNNKVQEL